MRLGFPGEIPPLEAMDLGEVLRTSIEENKSTMYNKKATGPACSVIT